MVVTILGGSAPSTPALVDWLAKQELPSPITIRLAGRSADRLAAVARACAALASGSCIAIQTFRQEHWEEALSGANVVLIQARIGGLPGRAFDETFPNEHGVPGDEGLGPGGLSAAVRGWPELRKILHSVFTCAPASLPLLLTSPGSLLARAVALEFPEWPVYPICELPFTTLAKLCASQGIPTRDVSFSYFGVNHLGWLYNVEHLGVDLIDDYARRSEPPFRELVEECGAIPLKYWRLHFERETVICEQRRAGVANSRASQLEAIQAEALLAFRSGGIADIRRALAKRPAEWYSDAVGPLLAQVAGQEGSHPFFVSTIARDGQIRECACRFEQGAFKPLPMDEPPPRVRDLVKQFSEYEEIAAASVLEPGHTNLSRALRAHPWVTNREQARHLADEILTGLEDRRRLGAELACLN
ncbi:MAG: hypothetical protein M3Y72_11590 [Acidobacteriota bacterium]|nr:hypothetical protein [Acidobacteriota bacterium]